MQTLESLKRSIKSAEDLAGVVRTMKTMAAVSIRQYETAEESLGGYSQTIETGLQMLLGQQHDESGGVAVQVERTGAIVFGSDQGMCGQFNEQISQFTIESPQLHAPGQTARGHSVPAHSVPVICIGHRVADKFISEGIPTDRVFRLPGSVTGITSLVQDLLPAIDAWRADHHVTRIFVFHNRRLSASSWQPYAMQLLPLQLDRMDHYEESGDVSRSLPFWTMDTSVLFSRLVQQFLFVSLFRACAESLAGENASRIAAMQSAERNIRDRIHILHTDYAQRRQTTITEELLDVVTGFEALKDSPSK